MKIVHISSTDQGGAAASCIRLHVALLEAGVDSNLITISKRKSGIPQHFTFSAHRPAHIVHRLMIRLKLRLPAYLKRQKALENKVAGYEHFSFPESEFDLHKSELIAQADIVNLHWTAGFLDYKTFFREVKKNIVWTLHDMNAFTAGCHYASGCEKYTGTCDVCPQLRGTVQPHLTRKLLRIKKKNIKNVNLTIVTPSQWLKQCSQKSSLFKHKSVFVIPYSLNLEVFKPVSKKEARERLALPPEKKIILFVSHSIGNKRKGFDILLECFSKFKAEEDVILLSAGNGGLDKKFNNHIALGEINSEEEMKWAYNAADVFVLPSLEDNLPNVALESIACGVPVIAFDTGGLPDIIKNGINGLLSKEINANALAQTISYFFKHSSTFDSKKIRKDAEERYNNKLQADAYSLLYQHLLNKRK